jgi:hypothetical protein
VTAGGAVAIFQSGFPVTGGFGLLPQNVGNGIRHLLRLRAIRLSIGTARFVAPVCPDK